MESKRKKEIIGILIAVSVFIVLKYGYPFIKELINRWI